MKRVIFLTAVLFPLWGLGGFSLHAQDTITLTWQGSTNKKIQIGMPWQRVVIINWGDGSVPDTLDTRKPNPPSFMYHSYADTTRNYNVTITATNDSVLMSFDCPSQQVSSLDVSKCKFDFFEMVYCHDNRLLLSELYKIFQMSPYTKPQGFALGTQKLLPQRILVGSSVDYSDQAEFGGIPTVFNVEKNGFPALLNKIIPS